MVKQVIILIFCLIGCSRIISQSVDFPADAKASTVGYSTTAAPGTWADANPAIVAHLSGIAFSANVRNRFSTDGLYDYGIYGNTILGKGGLGFYLSHFGFENFRQQYLALSYGMKMSDLWAIGIKASYYSLTQELQDPFNTIQGSLGIHYKLNNEVNLGLELSPFGLSATAIDLSSSQKIGFQYRPGNLLSVSGDVHYNYRTSNQISAGFGLLYQILDQVEIGLGYRSNPDSFGFGIGWKITAYLRFQIAASSHINLGLSTLGGFSYFRNNHSH